jgi:hypothetical protein
MAVSELAGPSGPIRRPATRRRASHDSLRRRALEKLTAAIAQAVETASDETLADIAATSDLRYALTIAPRDLAPPPPARLEAERAARAKTAHFRDELAARAGGMYNRAQVASLLGITAAAIDKQRQRHQILGVPYGPEIRYPAAQFADGEPIRYLKTILEAFDDMSPWGQLQLLTTPIDGYADGAKTVFELLAAKPNDGELRQLAALVSGWAA